MFWPPPPSIFTAEFPFSNGKGKFPCKDRHFYPRSCLSLQCKDREFPRNFDVVPYRHTEKVHRPVMVLFCLKLEGNCLLLDSPSRAGRAPNIFCYAPDIWPWPGPWLQRKINGGKQWCLNTFLEFDPELWPSTLTYNSSLADPCTKY